MTKYTIQEIIDWVPSFSMLFLLHLSLERVTEVENDAKGRFMSFKVTTSNESSLFAPLQGIAPENS